MNTFNIAGNSIVSAAASLRVATTLSQSANKSKSASGTVGQAAKTVATNSTTSSTADGATITSSDFLTLLVSELKNQDPTQPTDPNAYITQLVGVNSLQQLISIDQGITSLEPAEG